MEQGHYPYSFGMVMVAMMLLTFSGKLRDIVFGVLACNQG
jgi:hypothetical protein